MPEGIIYSSQLVEHVTNYLNYGLECKQSETAQKIWTIWSEIEESNQLGACEMFRERHRLLIEMQEIDFKLSL